MAKSEIPFVTIMVCVVVMMIALLFFYRKLRHITPNQPSNQIFQLPSTGANSRHKSTAEVQQRERTVKAMYVPQAIGVPSGKERLFMTNKGLRMMPVTVENFPLPVSRE